VRNALRLQRYSVEEAEQEIKANLGIYQLHNQLTSVQNRQDHYAREFQSFQTQRGAATANEARQEIKANLGIDQLQNQLTCVQNRQDDHAREFQNFRTQCTANIASKADMEYVDDL